MYAKLRAPSLICASRLLMVVVYQSLKASSPSSVIFLVHFIGLIFN